MAKKTGFFAEFKTFITRGNVLDMAVGVIVGGAFTAIVNALTNNILRPLINWIIALVIGGDGDVTAYTILKAVMVDGKVDLASSIYIDWGAFISAIINFLLIAFVLFCIVKAINSVNEANQKLLAGLNNEEKKEVRRLMKEEGLTEEEAKAQIKANEEAAAKAAEEEAAKAAEAEAAKAAEEEAKAMANTVLLTEIRDLLKNK